jgi:hypothetical protein
MKDDSRRTLEKLQSSCANLRTLATSPRGKGGLEPRLGENGGPKMVAEALAEIDALFRAISSLQEIIVEVYKDGISTFSRHEMESHGWIVRAVEEEWDERSWGDFEDDDHLYSVGDRACRIGMYSTSEGKTVDYKAMANSADALSIKLCFWSN